MTLRRLLIVLFASGLVFTGISGASGNELHAVVGPDFTIFLDDGSGTRTSHLDPGVYSLTVDDRSDGHDFHLFGPGVDATTTVEGVGVKTFSVNLVDGKYTYVCDLHPVQMKGSFTVGTVPSTPPPPTPSPATTTRLVLTVTSQAVALKTPAGKAVKALKAGKAVISVRDRSATRGIRLSGAGVSKTTGVTFVGSTTWTVKLKKVTLVYTSDARAPVLRGGRVPVS
jgi:plastocyanin